MGVANTYWLIDTCTGTYDIDLAEFLLCDLEHALQLNPIAHVGLLENSPSGTAGVLLDEDLRLGAQGQIRD